MAEYRGVAEYVRTSQCESTDKLKAEQGDEISWNWNNHFSVIYFAWTEQEGEQSPNPEYVKHKTRSAVHK